MKRCNHCCIEYSDEYTFCPLCGGSLISVNLQAPSPARVCPKCGAAVPDGAVICPGCGSFVPNNSNATQANSRPQNAAAMAGNVYRPDNKSNTAYPNNQPGNYVNAGYSGGQQSNYVNTANSNAGRQSSYVNSQGYPGDQTVIDASNGYEQKAAPAPRKGKTRNQKLIIGGVIAAFVLFIVGYIYITTPQELILNDGETVQIYVGDQAEVSLYSPKLDTFDYMDAEWTSDDTNVLTVTDGLIEASYSRYSFDEIPDDETESDMNPCECTTKLHATIKKGLRVWEGEIPVLISLKPVEVVSGTLIKDPIALKMSQYTVTASPNYNTYIYLKSTTDETNDMSFVVKQGETITLDVPMDVYEVYYAFGNTWYGSEFLFGPDMTCEKADHEYDFETYTWTSEFDVSDGNSGSETVDPDEFPQV